MRTVDEEVFQQTSVVPTALVTQTEGATYTPTKQIQGVLDGLSQRGDVPHVT